MSRPETERGETLLSAASARSDGVWLMAPCDESVLSYDRRHLSLYAALLDADDAGLDWRDAAATLMGIDVNDAGAEPCWRSHLERARWIVGNGLAAAIAAFGTASDHTT